MEKKNNTQNMCVPSLLNVYLPTHTLGERERRRGRNGEEERDDMYLAWAAEKVL